MAFPNDTPVRSKWLESVQMNSLDAFSKMLQRYRQAQPGQISFTAQEVLNLAVELGRLQMIQLLLSEPSFRLVENKAHHEAMFFAIKAEEESIMKVIDLLRRYGANFQARTTQNETVLHIAAQKGYVSFLNRMDEPRGLAELRGITEIRDTETRTALHVAAEQGKRDIAALLIQKYGADIRAKTLKQQKGTALYLAVAAEAKAGLASSELSDTVALLLRESDLRRVTAINTKGWRALHWLAWYERLDLIRCLVSCEADVEVKDSRGRRPLDIAIQVAENKAPWAPSAEVVEMAEWLTPPERGSRTYPSAPELMRPLPQPGMPIDKRPVRLVALSRGGWIETSAFSVRSAVYKYGPIPIMKTLHMEEVPGGSDDVDYILSWIHLPGNNDVAKSIYFSRYCDALNVSEPNPMCFETQEECGSSGETSPDDDDSSEEDRLYEASMDVRRKYGRLDDFMKDSLDQDSGSPQYRFLQPFFRYFRPSTIDDGPSGITHWERHEKAPIERGRIALSIPYLCFKKKKFLKHRSELRHMVASDQSKIDQTSTEEGSLHSPLTLDQFYYHSLGSNAVEKRTEGQVLFRHQRCGPHPVAPEERLVCMVDQFWLHIVDDDTVVTSASEGLDSTRSIRDIIGQHLLYGKETRPPLISPFGMVPLAIGACVRETIDLEIGPNRERLLHVFAIAIAQVADQEVELFDKFIYEVKLFDEVVQVSDSKGNDASNILQTQEAQAREILHGAIDCLKEVKDILDELNIIKTMLMCQSSVLLDAFACLTRLNNGTDRSANKSLRSVEKSLRSVEKILTDTNRICHENRTSQRVRTSSSSSSNRSKRTTRPGLESIYASEDEDQDLTEDEGGSEGSNYRGGAVGDGEEGDDHKQSVVELVDYYRAYSKLDTTTQEVDKLLHDASQVRDNLNHLLDLHQKHSQLIEAAWARKASNDATKQGRTIMVFTVVTIVFLPITFLSTLFALDISVFPHNEAGDLSYPTSWAFSWLFGLGFPFSAVLVLLAFYVNNIADLVDGNSNARDSRMQSARVETTQVCEVVEDHLPHWNEKGAGTGATFGKANTWGRFGLRRLFPRRTQ